MKPNAKALPSQEDPSGNITQPAGNASHPLQKRRARSTAHADQTTLQEKGPNALPVSDYPLKKGPNAANSVDLEEQARLRTGANKEK